MFWKKDISEIGFILFHNFLYSDVLQERFDEGAAKFGSGKIIELSSLAVCQTWNKEDIYLPIQLRAQL